MHSASLLVYTKPFHLYSHEHLEMASTVLAQKHGGGMCPCVFLLKTLNPVAAGLPACLRADAVAACAFMVTDAEKIVPSHPLTTHTAHQVRQVSMSMAHVSKCRILHFCVDIQSAKAGGFRASFFFWVSGSRVDSKQLTEKPISYSNLMQDLIFCV